MLNSETIRVDTGNFDNIYQFYSLFILLFMIYVTFNRFAIAELATQRLGTANNGLPR